MLFKTTNKMKLMPMMQKNPHSKHMYGSVAMMSDCGFTFCSVRNAVWD